MKQVSLNSFLKLTTDLLRGWEAQLQKLCRLWFKAICYISCLVLYLIIFCISTFHNFSFKVMLSIRQPLNFPLKVKRSRKKTTSRNENNRLCVEHYIEYGKMQQSSMTNQILYIFFMSLLVCHQAFSEGKLNVHLPDNLHFSCTFGLFLFPLWIVPVQFIEENNQCWHQVQMFIHPTCFQDAFRDIPLIGCSLDRYKED